ncbi:MAG: Ldh family oxidoreductase [Actinobacteria bacterium]|nr:Ldh family oxidoreductase [Actinomycetota bacterium]
MARTTADPDRYDATTLRDYTAAVLETTGVPRAHARLTAHSLLDANLRGVDTHGVARLPIYVKRLKLGAVNPRPHVRLAVDGATTVVVDGDAGLGQVVCDVAMRATIERARMHGVCWTGVRNSSHNGTQAYWALQGAREGLLTWTFTNGESNMAPWGGRERFLSTNPVCLAVPAAPPDELVLDMASSQVAAGHILLALNRGAPIPPGWALDADGNETTDPQRFIDGGTVLPLGGYKGAGLSLMVDLIAGVLSGAASTRDVGGMYWTFDRPQNVGHAMLAVDVQRLLPLAEFQRRAAATVAALRASARRPGVAQIFAPGDIERAQASERTKHGCPLTPDIVSELAQLGSDCGVPFPGELGA